MDDQGRPRKENRNEQITKILAGTVRLPDAGWTAAAKIGSYRST